MPGLVRRPLAGDVSVTIHVVTKKGRVRSTFAEYGIGRLRKELADVHGHRMGQGTVA